MKLKRELGLLDVFCITAGTVISAELFLLPGIAYSMAGPAMIISYMLAGLLCLPAVLSASELITSMPKAGAMYVFVRHGMGDAAGTVAGFSRWFAISFKGALALVGMGAYAALVSGMPVSIVALSLCMLFIIVNLLGIKFASKAEIIMTVGLLATLVLYSAWGLLRFDPARYANFAPGGIGSILSASAFLFFAYGGMLLVTSLAEEIKRPEKNIPLGMMLALVFVSVLYGLCAFSTVNILEPSALVDSVTPISDAAGVAGGTAGVAIMAVSAVLAFVTTANAGISAASRYPMAMARDHLLPGIFKKVGRRFRTPHFSILATGAFMLLAIQFMNLEMLVKTASNLLMLSFILVNLSVIMMRRRPGYRPLFRSPLYPLPQIIGSAGLAVLVCMNGFFPLLISVFFVADCFCWYMFYSGLKSDSTGL